MASSHTDVWQRARVLESVAITTDIRRMVLEPSLPGKSEPGAHIDVKVEIAGTLERRSYSIVDASMDGTRVAISVMNSPRSRGGAAAMHALRAGDELDITKPLLDFPLRLGAERYVLLAGGIGITAIAGMALALKSAGAEYSLVYAGRSRRVMAYLDELHDVHADRLELHLGDEGTSLVVSDLVGSVTPTTELYMCGPIRLMDAVRRAWTERALTLPNLRYETFGNSGWYEQEEFVVSVPDLGLEAVVGRSQSMLEALQAAGADMMYDCRKGECGLCEVRILSVEGVVDHRDVFYSERQKIAGEKMCCCVSRIAMPNGRPGRAVVTIRT
jgi:ferredoxin-NADP reductase